MVTDASQVSLNHVFVVDDHQIFLDGIRLMLNAMDEDIQVTTFENGEVALEQLDSGVEIDLLLLDMSMPDIDGLGFLKALKYRNLSIPVIVVSATENLSKIRSVIEAGAKGFIPKSYRAAEIQDAIQVVLSGTVFLPQSLQSLVLEKNNSNLIEGENSAAKTHDGISGRQLEVLELSAKGFSNKQIARFLYLSENTVKTHVTRLFQFFEVTNRTACVAKAQDSGVI